MRALVTGGAGFIGSHLVDRLVADGRPVTVLDDFSTGQRANLQAAMAAGDVRIVEGSILDHCVVEDAVADCNQVYHLAVQCVRRSIGDPLKNHEINATGTLNVLEAARRGQIGHFLYCSSSEVYGNASAGRLSEKDTICAPTTVYGAAKLAGEFYARAYEETYGLPVTILRPFNAYGPRAHEQGDLAEVIPRFVIRVLNDKAPIIFGDGRNGRDFTYVTETADALVRAGATPAAIGRTINIAAGRVVDMNEIASAMLRLCQKPHLSAEYHDARPGDIYSLHADTGLAEEILGFRAQISFEDGLTRYLDWFGNQHPDPTGLLELEPRNWRLPD